MADIVMFVFGDGVPNLVRLEATDFFQICLVPDVFVVGSHGSMRLQSRRCNKGGKTMSGNVVGNSRLELDD